LGDAPIAALVDLDLISPKFRVGVRQILAAAAVPEAAIHEYRHLPARPREIRLARYGPMLPVPPNASRAQQFRQRKLGGRITARADSCHNLGSDFLRNVIHGLLPLLFYRFA
jgi:hypothetical protein